MKPPTENNENKHKVALETERVIRDYVACLRNCQGRDVKTLLRASRDGRETLEKASLPTVVRKETQRALDDFLDFALEDAFLSDEIASREATRFRDERCARNERARGVVWKALTTALCVAVCFVLAFKGAAIWTFALVLVVLHIWGDKEPFERAMNVCQKTLGEKEETK